MKDLSVAKMSSFKSVIRFRSKLPIIQSEMVRCMSVALFMTINRHRSQSYQASAVGHEDGEVGQVTAGAGGVALVGVQQFTALSGPVTHHASLRVVPERAVGIVVVLFLQSKNTGPLALGTETTLWKCSQSVC